MPSINGLAVATALIFFNILSVRADGGQSLNPIVPSCQGDGVGTKLKAFCEQNCYFLPDAVTTGFPLLKGSMICDQPSGSHLRNSRRFFEVCRIGCIQPGAELGANVRLYIGQSDIADAQVSRSQAAIEGGDGSMSSVVATTKKNGFGWPYCTGPADCFDAALRPLGYVAHCVIQVAQAAVPLAAICVAANGIQLQNGDRLGNAIASEVLRFVTGILRGVPAYLPAFLRNLNRFKGTGQTIGGGTGTGVSRLVPNNPKLRKRGDLSADEVKEQEDEIKEQDDQARMWASRICACNATYTSNGCCFTMDGIVWEDPRMNQGPVPVRDL